MHIHRDVTGQLRQALDLNFKFKSYLHEEPIEKVSPLFSESKESVTPSFVNESENTPSKTLATRGVMTQTLQTS